MTGLPTVQATAIPGLLLVRFPVHQDARGWFKENWHRAAMTEAGVPDFGPVQHNLARNECRGTTRGIHAEPWDKLVSLASGRAFGAWVDLRPGPGLGVVVVAELAVDTAVFVPRGVGNSYQTLVDETVYSYLVNEHWSPSADYVAVNPGDPALGIEWPIPLSEAVVSDKDRDAPMLAQIAAMAPPRTLILGAGGQVGRALRRALPDAEAIGPDHVDLGLPAGVAAWPWADYDVVVNAAAYTQVDAAETAAGRATAWAVNATAPAQLGRLAARHGFTLVHFSTDYVFDGATTRSDGYLETDPVSPLGVYGQTKAAGELGVMAAPHHLVLRTSWVVGDGHNFVRTMAALAARGTIPDVVTDQTGRLTSADDLATATRTLLSARADPGLYHVTGAGPEMSWYDVARSVFALCGRDPSEVRGVRTADYLRDHPGAPRPRRGLLDLTKASEAGVVTRPADAWLGDYVRGLGEGEEG